VAVHRLGSPQESLERCQVLFIPSSERVRLTPLLKVVAQRPILTVSDIEGFARRGGILQMYSAASRIRFVINRASAQRAGLRIAAPLLDLAEVAGD
jgi:hypothetical protein